MRLAGGRLFLHPDDNGRLQPYRTFGYVDVNDQDALTGMLKEVVSSVTRNPDETNKQMQLLLPQIKSVSRVDTRVIPLPGSDNIWLVVSDGKVIPITKVQSDEFRNYQLLQPGQEGDPNLYKHRWYATSLSAPWNLPFYISWDPQRDKEGPYHSTATHTSLTGKKNVYNVTGRDLMMSDDIAFTEYGALVALDSYLRNQAKSSPVAASTSTPAQAQSATAGAGVTSASQPQPAVTNTATSVNAPATETTAGATSSVAAGTGGTTAQLTPSKQPVQPQPNANTLTGPQLFRHMDEKNQQATFLSFGYVPANSPNAAQQLANISGIQLSPLAVREALYVAQYGQRNVPHYIQDKQSGFWLIAYNGNIYPIVKFTQENEALQKMVGDWSSVRQANPKQLPFLSPQTYGRQQYGSWGYPPAWINGWNAGMAAAYGWPSGNPYMLGWSPPQIQGAPYQYSWHP
jgi:hypothetical protein